MAEKKNLLDKMIELGEMDDIDNDDLYNRYKNPLNRPNVVYRAPLMKIGKSVFGKAYELGGGAKGASARDIIRDGMKDSKYPYEVLVSQRTKKRVDETKPWDFAVADKNTGEILGTVVSDTKKDARSSLSKIKADNWIPGENGDRFEIVENLKSNRRTASQQRDLDEFKKAFEDVRAQRDYYNNGPRRVQGDGDILANGTVREKQNLINTGNMGPHLYHVDSWDKWLSAKNASKEAGHKLGRLFAEQNQLERNVYGNISKGVGPKTEPVPGGPYKYALGNENHVYSRVPHKTEMVHMNLNDLQDAGHPIHYLENGNPIVDMYTWTHKDNIDRIKKTGYAASVGPDTKHYHPGAKGIWTSWEDNHPMQGNMINNVRLGEIGPNGENYNMELLHTQVPLNVFNNRPVIHQGKSVGTHVDIVQAKPGSPELIIGEGKDRRLEKVAMSPNYITHVTENEIRPDWVTDINLRYGWRKTLPGFHPNKKYYGSLESFLAKTSPDKELSSLGTQEMADMAINDAKNPSKVKNYLFDKQVYKMIDDSKKKDYLKYIDGLSKKGLSPYDLSKVRDEIFNNAINSNLGIDKLIF